MLTHFQYQSLYQNKSIPGWQFSFYYKRKKITGLYHGDGRIQWIFNAPEQEDDDRIKKQIQELMIYHVYE